MEPVNFCDCAICKESQEFKRLLDAYVPKEHHKFFEDIYLRLACVETDAAMADFKMSKIREALGADKLRAILRGEKYERT